jgi:hypothetical protein
MDFWLNFVKFTTIFGLVMFFSGFSLIISLFFPTFPEFVNYYYLLFKFI